MQIAVIGGGITGLGAALALGQRPDTQVTLFDSALRLGGHAHTVTVDYPDGPQPVDVGFIVFNEKNYPNLCALFRELEVPTHWSDMSFGFSLNGGACEYACDNLDKLFAQRWRAADPRFLMMARDILRFNRLAPADLGAGRLDGLSLRDWLARHRFTPWFRDRFLLPMGGAIWSTSTREILDFPARNFITFFANHDLMTGLDPAQRWRTVTGGSQEYVRRLAARLGDRARTGRTVTAVLPGPRLRFADGAEQGFDQVVLACHAPQALALLAAPDAQTRATLGAFRTSANRAVLHSDPSAMPRRRKAWSSWNFLSQGAAQDGQRPAQVTYWMNRLQGLPAHRPLFVSLNPATPLRDVHGSFDFAHPLYDAASFAGQAGLDAIQGRGGLWFAGAWAGYGFHEDGLTAGLRVAAALGARPSWAARVPELAPRLAHAAE